MGLIPAGMKLVWTEPQIIIYKAEWHFSWHSMSAGDTKVRKSNAGKELVFYKVMPYGTRRQSLPFRTCSRSDASFRNRNQDFERECGLPDWVVLDSSTVLWKNCEMFRTTWPVRHLLLRSIGLLLEPQGEKEPLTSPIWWFKKKKLFTFCLLLIVPPYAWKKTNHQKNCTGLLKKQRTRFTWIAPLAHVQLFTARQLCSYFLSLLLLWLNVLIKTSH